MLYRIYTKDLNNNRVQQIASKYFPGFTITKSMGYWQGQKENSVVLEIVTNKQDAKVRKLAKEIKIANKQEAVLVQRINNNQWLI